MKKKLISASEPGKPSPISWDKWLFFTILFIIVYCFGVFAGHSRLFPYSVMIQFGQLVQVVKMELYYLKHKELTNLLFVEPVAKELDNGGQSITGQSEKGLYLMTGFWDMSHEVRLLNERGELRHRWHVNYDELWTHPSHVKNQLPNLERHLNGAVMNEDGSVVMNFEFGGLVKLDYDSNIIWKLPHATHHSIQKTADGHLWVCGGRMHHEPLQGYENILPPLWEDAILEIDPDGRILREISLFDVLHKSNYKGAVFGNGANKARYRHDVELDLLHLNDAEVLEADLAHKYPQFEAGDILVSLRNVNTLMVLDGQDETVKWSMTGPFLRQHDPDFGRDGRILVFDNHTVNAAVTKSPKAGVGTSRILAIDPVTRAVETIYQGTEDTYFFSRLMGRVQELDNGNFLITETLQGRVFELTTDGRIVWTYTNWWDDNEVAWIEEAVPYPADFLTINSSD